MVKCERPARQPLREAETRLPAQGRLDGYNIVRPPCKTIHLKMNLLETLNLESRLWLPWQGGPSDFAGLLQPAGPPLQAAKVVQTQTCPGCLLPRRVLHRCQKLIHMSPWRLRAGTGLFTLLTHFFCQIIQVPREPFSFWSAD